MTACFLQQIKSHLPDSSLPWVIASLREESLIWDSLQEPDFQQRLFSQTVEQPKAWSPANLALLAINLPVPAEGLAADQLNADLSFPLDVGIRRRAARAYESMVAGSPVPTDTDVEGARALVGLAAAGLVALALRERRRLIGNWQGLRGEVTLLEQWKASLACLFGMIPDPLDMLQALLLPGGPAGYHRLVVHILLSQPLAPDVLKENIKSLLTRLSLVDKVNLLTQLSLRRLDLAGCLANELLPVSTNPQPALPVHDSLLGYSDHLKHILLHVEANRLAGQSDQVSTYLNAAWEASFRLQAELAARVGDGVHSQGDFTGALTNRQQAFQLAPGNPYYQADLALALFEAGQTEQAIESLAKDSGEDETETPHPSILFASIIVAMQTTDREGARQAALQLLQYLEAGDARLIELLEEPKEERGMFLVQLFMELDMIAEAVKACQRLLVIMPDHLGLLVLLGKAYMHAGDPQEAVSTLLLASAFDPSQPGLRRQLANAYEDTGDWNAALVERTSIVKVLSAGLPTPTDLHALANCALHAGQPGQAVEACQQALEQDADDGKAHFLLGEALSALGDRESAQNHLTKATQLAPQLAGSWLGLSRLQKDAGFTDRALETLRAGAQSAPDSPEIYLALGDAYQEDWEGLGHPSPTQALSMYQQAANWLVKESSYYRSASSLSTQIALRLGQTLHQLGRLEEARQVLEQAYQEMPAYPGLAYAYAQNLLVLKEFHTAVPVLEQVLSDHPDNPAPYLDYARALLSISEKPGQAVQALQTVLEKTPDHAEAQALLAEALAASADFPAALQAFQKALETDLVADAVWSSRLSLGLGQVSLALHHPEIAIAALQEAGQADPLNPRIAATLAEAYLAAGLFEDALQSARSALSLASEDLDTLVWFGGKAVELIQRDQDPESGLGETTRAQVRQEAINAYQRALQLAPGRADVLVSLGAVLWQAGDENAALEAFHQVVAAENPSVADLHQAAQSLLKLGDAPAAVACLEKALHIDPDLAFDASTPDSLAFTLVSAYQKSGNPQAALSVLEQALAFSGQATFLFPLKADLLLELNRPAEALATLQDGLKMETSSERLLDFRYQAALLKRFNGDMDGALAEAEQILVATQNTLLDPWRLSAQCLAADLYRAILQPAKSCAYLETLPAQPQTAEFRPEQDGDTSETEKDAKYTQSLFDYLCLRAELALDSGEDRVAASILDGASGSLDGGADSGRQARLLSIRSRLAGRQGDADLGITQFQQALAALGIKDSDGQMTSPQVSLGWLTYLYRTLIPTLLSLSEAALEIHHWDTALHLLQSIAGLAEREALPYLQLARGLTLRAETQYFYQSLEAITHSPGEASLTDGAWKAFESA
ncbi:MAG: tetratricopeptide repeat protein, partial [Omnitrophica WOR_2 bacterium]